MLNQTIKTLTATMAPTTEPLVKMLDKSVRVRLKTMASRFENLPEMVYEGHDNFLRGAVQTIVCLRRAKKANQLGLYYWYRSQEETNEQFKMDYVHNGFNKLHGYLLLMKKEPELCGGLEFLDTEAPHQFESFNSFMASSMKEKIVDTYFISKKDMLNLRGNQISAPAQHECPNCGYNAQNPSHFNATNFDHLNNIYEQEIQTEIETEVTTITQSKVSGIRRISQSGFDGRVSGIHVSTHEQTFSSKVSGVRQIIQPADFQRFAAPQVAPIIAIEVDELFSIPDFEFTDRVLTRKPEAKVWQMNKSLPIPALQQEMAAIVPVQIEKVEVLEEKIETAVETDKKAPRAVKKSAQAKKPATQKPSTKKLSANGKKLRKQQDKK